MRLGENDHAVLFSFHHIIFDGWSIGVFVRELSALYRARIAGVPASLPPLAIQYADFAAWQRGWLQGEVLERQVAWWRGQLTGAAVLELPTDRPRPILAQAPSGLLHPLLRPSLTEPLRAFSRDHGATLFMTLLAGFQALLHRHTGQTDISVGTPIANRNHGDVEKLIGFFVNMLVLRTDLSGDPGFGDLVDRVRQTALGAYDHQSVPFAKLVEELRPERDLRHTPLFQVSFQLLNIPQSPLELPGITLHPLSFAARSAKFDLDLALTDAARPARRRARLQRRPLRRDDHGALPRASRATARSAPWTTRRGGSRSCHCSPPLNGASSRSNGTTRRAPRRIRRACIT